MYLKLAMDYSIFQRRTTVSIVETRQSKGQTAMSVRCHPWSRWSLVVLFNKIYISMRLVVCFILNDKENKRSQNTNVFHVSSNVFFKLTKSESTALQKKYSRHRACYLWIPSRSFVIQTSSDQWLALIKLAGQKVTIAHENPVRFNDNNNKKLTNDEFMPLTFQYCVPVANEQRDEDKGRYFCCKIYLWPHLWSSECFCKRQLFAVH